MAGRPEARRAEPDAGPNAEASGAKGGAKALAGKVSSTSLSGILALTSRSTSSIFCLLMRPCWTRISTSWIVAEAAARGPSDSLVLIERASEQNVGSVGVAPSNSTSKGPDVSTAIESAWASVSSVASNARLEMDIAASPKRCLVCLAVTFNSFLRPFVGMGLSDNCMSAGLNFVGSAFSSKPGISLQVDLVLKRTHNFFRGFCGSSSISTSLFLLGKYCPWYFLPPSKAVSCGVGLWVTCAWAHSISLLPPHS
mmetsp:Transcript_74597/g.199698  ORF Transcript_74597/g.199698 Transcript_74597/m.199698 type:complete len:254 (-) Transcript_74597:302-1063(-)